MRRRNGKKNVCEVITLRKLDKYIIKTFIGPFILGLIFFSGLYIVIDYFSNIDDYLTQKDSVLQSLMLTGKYYLFQLPRYLAMIMPVLVVVPAAIAILRLEKSNELCAMKASGVSCRRMMLPLVFCAVVITIIAAFNQEYLVPAQNESFLRAERLVRGWNQKYAGRMSYVTDHHGRHFLVKVFDADIPLPTLTNIRISWDDPRGGHFEKRATRAFYMKNYGGWYLDGVSISSNKGRSWETLPPEPLASKAVEQLIEKYRNTPDNSSMALITSENGVSYEFGSYTETKEYWAVARDVEIIVPTDPRFGSTKVEAMVWADGHWIVFGAIHAENPIPGKPILDVQKIKNGSLLVSPIKPAEVRDGEFKRLKGSMTLAQLAEAGSLFPSSRFRQRCWVVIWNRISYLLANIVLVLVVVPVIFKQTTRTALVGVSFALLITLVYFMIDSVSLELGTDSVFLWSWPPFAGLLPTAIFATAGYYLLKKVDNV